MLRAMRGRHGGPHLGVRAVALVVALLLAAPLSFYVVRGLAALARTLF